MKIHYTLDDSAVRLPLAIRSAENIWDRAVELRSAPGIHLVELTTQHMLNTGAVLIDELANYFDNGGPSEADPYALAACYADRTSLEDLLRDLQDSLDDLIAFEEVEELFPPAFAYSLPLTLVLTAVGFPAFGYMRTYKDSEGEEYHGLVVNLAQARPHLEHNLGHFSLSLLIDMIRYGFFNHQAFLLAYTEYREAILRKPVSLVEQLKENLLCRGTAWYVGYRHNLAFYDDVLGLDRDQMAGHVACWNRLVGEAIRANAADDALDEWLRRRGSSLPGANFVDVMGYYVACAVAHEHGPTGLREAIIAGPDHFITLFNKIGPHTLQ